MELLFHLHGPLLAQGGRTEYQESPFSLRPELTQNDARLDCLAEPHLVRQEYALGEWRFQGEQGSFDLMRVEINGSVEQGHGQAVHAARRQSRQVMREILRLVASYPQIRCSRFSSVRTILAQTAAGYPQVADQSVPI
jgi:hypothetical protein